MAVLERHPHELVLPDDRALADAQMVVGPRDPKWPCLAPTEQVWRVDTDQLGALGCAADHGLRVAPAAEHELVLLAVVARGYAREADVRVVRGGNGEFDCVRALRQAPTDEELVRVAVGRFIDALELDRVHGFARANFQLQRERVRVRLVDRDRAVRSKAVPEHFAARRSVDGEPLLRLARYSDTRDFPTVGRVVVERGHAPLR
mmetsp:Transcript_6918/g.22832  ORF Transcript_6918/g.22832 Transcript_6918/m.22832 type:complete len:204 (-) Transcript_6918:340-951(-)